MDQEEDTNSTVTRSIGGGGKIALFRAEPIPKRRGNVPSVPEFQSVPEAWL
jgi:hypothetical protein